MDDVLAELGHGPHGAFWDGFLELLVMTDAATRDGRFWSDPEAGACGDRAVLDNLAVRP